MKTPIANKQGLLLANPSMKKPTALCGFGPGRPKTDANRLHTDYGKAPLQAMTNRKQHPLRGGKTQAWKKHKTETHQARANSPQRGQP